MPNLAPPSPAALRHFVQQARARQLAAPRPANIVQPGPGQESVWDFPRPPRVEPVGERVNVIAFGIAIADSTHVLRVVETAGAPCYYIPPADCQVNALVKTDDWTICEWKGIAFAYDVVVGDRRAKAAAWSFPEPLTDLGAGYERIAGYFAFYAARVEACYVGNERVRPQGGGYYGGWVRSNLTGPIKGDY